MRRLLPFSFLALLLSAAPAMLTEAPAHAQAAIRIQVAPPVPRVEVIPIAPSPRHVWIPGYWDWNGQRHVWVNGYHEIPPGAGYHWVPAHWANEGGFWVMRRGHWAPNAPEVFQPVQQEVYVQQPPPPPQEEVIPPSPGMGQVWIPGHWQWDAMAGRHVWVPGHYRMGEPGRTWIPAHWVRTWRGWQMVPGHWRGGFGSY